MVVLTLSGAEYPAHVPYVAMRVTLATFGVGMVPLGWYTAVELGMSQWACHLVALLVLFCMLHKLIASFGALMVGICIDVGWLCRVVRGCGQWRRRCIQLCKRELCG